MRQNYTGAIFGTQIASYNAKILRSSWCSTESLVFMAGALVRIVARKSLVGIDAFGVAILGDERAGTQVLFLRSRRATAEIRECSAIVGSELDVETQMPRKDSPPHGNRTKTLPHYGKVS